MNGLFGDMLLQGVAERWRALLRRTDAVARLGGDEFVVLIADAHRIEDVARIARKMLTCLQLPFSPAGHDVKISASMGISIFPDDAGDYKALLKNADHAMYRVKRAGRNDFAFYSGEHDAAAAA